MGGPFNQKKVGMPFQLPPHLSTDSAKERLFSAYNSCSIDSMASNIGGGALRGNYMIRFFSSAVGSGTCVRTVNASGIGWASTISAVVWLIGLSAMVMLIMHGEQLRSMNSKGP
ncbi:LADA_0B00320g1_1 [Lachancea dasiensis]|uniref:LADA_0B00320g1_1 n=1 Tax=Lachancea dasiensis TaxID=1072105 RepID=A0A1G4IRH5_9SACH|nr:LADA_0B00320g1_1 [Lachancea dasiensis]